jgi:prolyl-tRNA editing enzyme YbaK/EbsC (Cys-tRNA(Pro) deacylase)
MSELHPNAQRVQAALAAHGLTLTVIELPDSTRSAQEAAQAIGCQVQQIVKSLIFMRKESASPLLIAASGVNRVNEKVIGSLLGEKIIRPDADFVRLHTGYPIGGVPPLAHAHPLETLIDEDLLQYEEIWAAAGTPNAVFKLKPADLVVMTGGILTKIY